MPDTNHALTLIPSSGADTYRMSTDAASISKAIVVKTAMEIQGRKYVKVEGWQAIALAHGCTASSGNVERIDGGFRATGQVRRMDTGATIAEAEGFVGEDEAVWFGGDVTDRYGKKKVHPKRPDYAIRAMAQTRAISRACRSAFAHVVVMMDAGLQTTPAEEVPYGGFDDGPDNTAIAPSAKGTAGAGTQFRSERRSPGAAQTESLKVDPADADMVQGDGRSQYETDKAKKAAASTGPLGGRAATAAEARAAKITAGVNTNIDALKRGAPWTRDGLDQFWKAETLWIEWMSDPANKALDEYQRFLDVFNDATDNTRPVELA